MLLTTSAPAKRQAGRQLLLHSEHSGSPWEVQCRVGHTAAEAGRPGRSGSSCHTSPSEPQLGWGLRADRVRTWRLDLHLTMGAAQPCGAPLPGRSRPTHPQSPSPWGQSCLRSLPLRDRGSEPVGGRDARPLPGELNSDIKGTQRAHCAKGMEEVSALPARSAWPRRYSEVGKSRNKAEHRA